MVSCLYAMLMPVEPYGRSTGVIQVHRSTTRALQERYLSITGYYRSSTGTLQEPSPTGIPRLYGLPSARFINGISGRDETCYHLLPRLQCVVEKGVYLAGV